MKVVEFSREGWRDPVKTLRKIADELEAGEYGICKVGVLGMLTDSGEVEVFGFGADAEQLQSIAVLRLSEQKLIDTLLNPE